MVSSKQALLSTFRYILFSYLIMFNDFCQLLSPLTEPPSPHNNSFCATTMADTHLTGVTIDPSSPAIAQVRGNSTTSEDAKVSLPLWLSETMENTRKPNIPEVPVKLKEKKSRCYKPLAVSIGPYHYSDREGKLQEVEKLKARIDGQVCRR